MTLEVTLYGLPSPNLVCECPGTLYHRRHLLWDSLNRPFELIQKSPLSYQFEHIFITDCAEARDVEDAVLVEQEEWGDCENGDYQLSYQREVYLDSISMEIRCINGRMQIFSMAFSFCYCERYIVGDPPVWSDWSCAHLDQYPVYNTPVLCQWGDQIKEVVPCSSQQMDCEVLWNNPTTETDPCAFDFSCEEPIVGHVTARLGCG